MIQWPGEGNNPEPIDPQSRESPNTGPLRLLSEIGNNQRSKRYLEISNHWEFASCHLCEFAHWSKANSSPPLSTRPQIFQLFPLERIPFQSKSQHFVQRFEPEISRPSIEHFCTFSLTNAGCSNINPFTPKISLVILLTICHTILIVLVRRIWYWINK